MPPVKKSSLVNQPKLIAEGKDVDYVGATNVEFDDSGDVPGSYREMEIKGGKFESLKIH